MLFFKQFFRRSDERHYGVLRSVTLALALIGAGFMGYLTVIHAFGGSAFCDFGEGFSCSFVNQSVYADILGVPLAVLGLGYFLTVAVLMAVRRWRGVFVWTLLLTLFSLLFGLYLSAIAHFVLQTICLYCELSKAVMLAIIGTSVAGIAAGDEDLPLEWIAWTVALAFVWSYGVWMIQRVPV